MGCPTPPPQQAEGAPPWISAASPQSGRNPGLSPQLGLENAIGLGPPAQGAQGHTLAVRVTWGKQQRAPNEATPQHEPTRVPTPSWGPTGLRALTAGHLPVPPEPWDNCRVPGRHCHANLGQDKPNSHSPRPITAPLTLSLKPVQELQPVPREASRHGSVAQPTLTETH